MDAPLTTEVSVLGGRYRLVHLLGRGGAGAVWAGHDKLLDRPVAVKMLRDDLGTEEPLQRERLLAEARSVAAVRHPNLVTAFDAGADDGVFAIVMERLPGPSLSERLHRGPISADEVRAVGTDVLAGLAALHEAGLVHRDVKPGNVLRADDGRWTLVDFGVAKSLRGGQDLTITGNTVGTPSYIAPEQLFGAAATPVSDLWAVGVMLYRAISGQLPFDGATPYAIAYAAYTSAPRPLSELVPGVDPAIARTVERALHQSLPQRFESAGAMAASLTDRSAGSATQLTPADAPHAVGGGIATRIRRPSSTRRLALAALVVMAMTAVTALGLGPARRDGGSDPSNTADEPFGRGDRAPLPPAVRPAPTDESPTSPSSDGTGVVPDGSPIRPEAGPKADARPERGGPATGGSGDTPRSTDRPGADPPVVDPPSTEAPVLNPPETSPPVINPPETSPPSTDPPDTKPRPPRPTPSSTTQPPAAP